MNKEYEKRKDFEKFLTVKKQLFLIARKEFLILLVMVKFENSSVANSNLASLDAQFTMFLAEFSWFSPMNALSFHLLGFDALAMFLVMLNTFFEIEWFANDFQIRSTSLASLETTTFLHSPAFHSSLAMLFALSDKVSLEANLFHTLLLQTLLLVKTNHSSPFASSSASDWTYPTVTNSLETFLVFDTFEDLLPFSASFCWNTNPFLTFFLSNLFAFLHKTIFLLLDKFAFLLPDFLSFISLACFESLTFSSLVLPFQTLAEPLVSQAFLWSVSPSLANTFETFAFEVSPWAMSLVVTVSYCKANSKHQKQQ